MNKAEIAERLEEIAVLLELKGENSFKTRAYQSGARLLDLMGDEEFRRHVEADDWRTVKGVGEALAAKIMELHGTGRLEFLEKLRASIPPGLVQMLEIPGLGPKKVKALNEQLGIETVAALEKACQEGLVAELSGFGFKTQDKILKGIANREAYSKRHLWLSVWYLALPILEQLRQLPQVRRAEAAGSLRRGMETVGDVDFIVASSEAAPVAAWFVSMPGVQEVTGQGETKCSVRLEGGLQADLRIVPEAQFAFALHHFTGSKQHNILMRQRALARGWSLSEWGLTPVDPVSSSMPPPVNTEEELFRTLGLHYIPPELREGMGEIEAAEKAPLPRLLEDYELKGAFHNHTTESDGKSTFEEMVREAERLGWDYLGIADHSKSSFQARGLDETRLLAQVAMIRRWNASARSRCHVFAGTECDILADGSLDFSDEILGQLDYVVASIHSGFGQDEETMTRRIIRAIEHPRVSMLGHASGRLLLRREPYAVDLSRVIDAAAANGVIIELNANPFRLDMDWRLWRKAAEKGVLCSINPDAHDARTLCYVEAGVKVARKGWLEGRHVFNTRSLSDIREWLRNRGMACP